MTFIIGELVKVAAAKNSAFIGLRGKVVMETMNTLTIKAGKQVTLPKLGSALLLSTGAVVLGEDLKGRLEDRIALTSRNARRAP